MKEETISMKQLPNLIMDFQSDWSSFLKTEIQSMGYVIDPNLKQRDISITYFNLQRRRIVSIPRKLIVSAEFSCPATYTAGLEMIKAKATNGNDLLPHQSTRLNDPNFDDALLNDWDIHHLHLGTTIQPNGFVERTGPVLFVRVTNDSLYLIDVMDHGLGHQPWIKKKLLESIHKNWPESIAHRKLKGITSVEFNPTDQDIGKLRKANVNLIYQMDDGTIYMPLGGGVMTSGVSAGAVNDSNYYVHLIRNIERWVKDNLSRLIEDAAKTGVTLSDDLHFRLAHLGNDSVSIFEEKSRMLWKLPIKK
jgi:hypothetical protein